METNTSIKKYLIAVIAKKTDIHEMEDFCYLENSYKCLVDLEIEYFLQAVSNVSEFILQVKDTFLILMFHPDKVKFISFTHYSKYLNYKNYICKLFLANENGEPLDENIETNEDEYDIGYSISKLFNELREEHTKDNLSHLIPENVQHENLKPILRPYQANAVKWMLHRELMVEYLSSDYIKTCTIPEYNLLSSEPEKHCFFYSQRTGDLSVTMPEDKISKIPIPSGGILADEMGLGKTVEVLALILLNKKKKRNYSQISNSSKLKFNDNITNPPDVSNINCICIEKIKTDLIQCIKCFSYQHKICVLKYEVDSRVEKHICPKCWQNEPLIQTSATIIVSPITIRSQWELEIEKHIKGGLKVFIYKGVKEGGWINPYVLSKYDIVITDYNVLRVELNYSQAVERNLRHNPRYMRPVSPLGFIIWWRVCLDEAQQVDTPAYKAAMMVKTIPAVHRWSITGTPVEKKFENLYGFLYFLGIEPYFTNSNIWKIELLLPFFNGNSKPLINVLKKIMWRTCKANVIDQINIPLQSEIIHLIPLFDVERFNYCSKHAECETAFNKKAETIVKIYETTHLDNHKLKLLMDPLRLLRQICTVSSISVKSESMLKAKQFLTPTELLDYLVRTNENTCKDELRTIISSYNGLAGIQIFKGHFSEAAVIYRKVLKIAKENTGNICVDSLLQIHALYNLSEILNEDSSLAGYSNREEYLKECKLLEWKYIEPYYSLVKALDEHILIIIESTREIERNFIDKEYWWRNYLFSTEFKINPLMDKLQSEVFCNVKSEVQDRKLESAYEVDFVLTEWWNDVLKTRSIFMNGLQKLEYFYKNLKSELEIDCEQFKGIKQLIHDVYRCHLRKRTLKEPIKYTCDICKLKTQLSKHECVIFNKFMNINNVEGTWNPTYQESMLKVIYHLAKKDKFRKDVLENGETCLQLIDQYKIEFKEYNKLWVEINYTANAYDELNMCRQRLVVGDTDMNIDTTISNIGVNSINSVNLEFEYQLTVAEMKYTKCLGRIQYLKHLESAAEQMCPICKEVLKNKYAVLQCGHHMCISCLVLMKKYQPNNLTCSICRNQQLNKHVYYVTCKNHSTDCDVNGNYSAKIEAIIKTIFKLRREDENIKIIIFSEWDDILKIISNALLDNIIKYRYCKTTYKMDGNIGDFKNLEMGITCLLLRVSCGSKGLNLIEATHVFLVEPILNLAEEVQAVGRIHRIGQTKPTFVHRFIMENTIEQNIHNAISKDLTGKWKSQYMNIDNLKELFVLDNNMEPVN